MTKLLVATFLLCGLTAMLAADDKPSVAAPAALNFTVKSIDGKEIDLAKTYQGKVVLIVNVASQCGATPQYAPLQELYDVYKDEGLVVLGFPCNQFGQQEPGSAEEIKEFCTANYKVSFDMFAKIDVNGDKADPLFKYLTGAESNPQFAGKVMWNFEKFLIGRDGKVVARYKTGISPDAEEVISAIKNELAKK